LVATTVQSGAATRRGRSVGSDSALAALEGTRARTLALVSHLTAAELEAVHSPVMGPLAWDLAHIAAYEDLWLCHRQCGLELLRPDLAELYDAFETPRAQRADGDAGFLNANGARAYMELVHLRACEALARGGVGDGTLFELVLRHELQHTETMRQAMNIAGLLPAGEPPTLAPQESDGEHWEAVPAGEFEIGASADGFAYDNERPRHRETLAAFAIARLPLTNAAWTRFRADGGYERREWWSEAGWRWLQTASAAEREQPPVSALEGDPAACLCHVSCFEAEALARANGARLPSEAEWERARGGAGRMLGGAGLVWEWTSSEFSGYPGFRAHPYREYSEVFFDRGYRVLRGSSWATHERVATPTFRNWDLPQRRQIFAGVRLAKDL
jgi:gamma-glutamyl hercynylcysteine S-oxide synthase